MVSLSKFKHLFLAEGIIFLILGILAVAAPFIFTIAFELMIGWLFVIGGIVLGYRAFTAKATPGFAFALVSSILYVIVGLLLLFYPLKGVLTLTFLLALFYFLEGVAQIVYATFIKEVANWGWLLVSGVLAILISFIIWSGWPSTAFWVLGLLVGINLIFYGVSRIFLATSLSKSNRH
jgi:uncharacterized membrane protein HdeD (DUF308 family)